MERLLGFVEVMAFYRQVYFIHILCFSYVYNIGLVREFDFHMREVYSRMIEDVGKGR